MVAPGCLSRSLEPLAPITPQRNAVRMALGSFNLPGTTDLGFKARTQLLPISKPMFRCASYGGISSAIFFRWSYFWVFSGPRMSDVRLLVYTFGRGMSCFWKHETISPPILCVSMFSTACMVPNSSFISYETGIALIIQRGIRFDSEIWVILMVNPNRMYHRSRSVTTVVVPTLGAPCCLVDEGVFFLLLLSPC